MGAQGTAAGICLAFPDHVLECDVIALHPQLLHDLVGVLEHNVDVALFLDAA